MRKILLLLLVFMISTQVYSQNTVNTSSYEFGKVHKIYSTHLKEDRILNIWLPVGYSPDSLKVYPVLYVLDGSSHEDFPHIAGIAHFFQMYQLMPTSIVVGIQNVDRYRDFTSPSSDPQDLKDLPTSGGAESFIKFLAEEVKPLIQSTYKVSDESILIGQSLGGLIGAEILYSQTTLFTHYILISPSLWWNKEKLLRKFILNPPSLRANQMVYIGVGKEHPIMVKEAKKIHKSLSSASQNVFFGYFPEEDHATILHNAVYKALKTLFPKPKK